MSISYPQDKSALTQSQVDPLYKAVRVTASLDEPAAIVLDDNSRKSIVVASVGSLFPLASDNENDQAFLTGLVDFTSNGQASTGSFFNRVSIEKFNASADAYGTLMGVVLTPLAQADFNYNINSELFTTSSLSGTLTTLSGNVEITCSGSSGSFAQLESKHYVRIRPGQGAGLRFSAHFSQAGDGTQIYGWGSSDNGYFVGVTGSEFAVLHRSHGIETWTTSSDFNIDKLNGSGSSGMTLDTSKGNVFDIQAQWLGYGSITFNIVNPNTGRFMPFHRIKYANENIVPSTRFNSEKVIARVDADPAGGDPVTIKGASLLTYVEGEPQFTGPRFAVANSKTGITTETNVITLQNKSTFHSLTNKIAIKLKSLAYAVEGTKPAVIRVYRNATLGGTPSYTDVNLDNSVISYDTAGTTVSGGSLVVSYAVGKSSSDVVYGNDLDLWVYPGETLTISAQSDVSTDASVSVSWIEDH